MTYTRNTVTLGADDEHYFDFPALPPIFLLFQWKQNLVTEKKKVASLRENVNRTNCNWLCHVSDFLCFCSLFTFSLSSGLIIAFSRGSIVALFYFSTSAFLLFFESIIVTRSFWARSSPPWYCYVHALHKTPTKCFHLCQAHRPIGHVVNDHEAPLSVVLACGFSLNPRPFLFFSSLGSVVTQPSFTARPLPGPLPGGILSVCLPACQFLFLCPISLSSVTSFGVHPSLRLPSAAFSSVL